jgi:Low affinity iron permease
VSKPRENTHPQKDGRGFSKIFGEVANKTSEAAGRASAFMIAAGVVVVWAITAPLFQYSDTWQLVINTGTTIVTFLMVFLSRIRKIGRRGDSGQAGRTYSRQYGA